MRARAALIGILLLSAGCDVQFSSRADFTPEEVTRLERIEQFIGGFISPPFGGRLEIEKWTKLSRTTSQAYLPTGFEMTYALERAFSRAGYELHINWKFEPPAALRDCEVMWGLYLDKSNKPMPPVEGNEDFFTGFDGEFFPYKKRNEFIAPAIQAGEKRTYYLVGLTLGAVNDSSVIASVLYARMQVDLTSIVSKSEPEPQAR